MFVAQLLPLSAQRMAYVSAGDDPPGEQAFAWLRDRCEATAISADELGSVSLDAYDAIWWHETHDSDRPMHPGRETAAALRSFLERGGGLLLTGFATQLVVPVGIQKVPPGAVFPEPTTSGNWGFTPLNPGHAIFEGFEESPILTLSAGSSVRNVISWWEDPARLNGRWLADNEGRIGRVAIAEFAHETGKVIAVGSGAFEWDLSPSQNEHHGNLARLTSNMIDYVSEPHPAPVRQFDIVAHWTFAEPDGSTTARDSISGFEDAAHNNFETPERFSLSEDRHALVFDGYSTWIRRDGAQAPVLYDEATWSLWVAPRSYPVEMAAFINQHNEHGGYFFGLTPFGQWGLRSNIGGMWHAIWAPDPLPLNEWSHLAVTFAEGKGLVLYRNGERVAHVPTYDARLHLVLDVDLMIGRNNVSGAVAQIFPTAVFAGLMSDVRLYRRALDEREIAELAAHEAYPQQAPFVHASERRFAADPHRPVYHAMPPADWTNESHGLVQDDQGTFHMFYQKNPAGPYWSFIHWGHMTSRDLVNWRHEPIALHPERRPGYSRHGVWSGDAAIEEGKLKLVYTAVDGARAVVAIAERPVGEHGHFRPYEGNPVIDGRPRGEALLDFRDPYVWKNPGEDEWNLVIGAGIPNVGGTSLIYRAPRLSGPWEYEGHFFSGDREHNGNYWEMPVVLHFDGDDRVWFGVSELPAINSYWIGSIQGHRFVPNQERSRPLEVINHLLSPTLAKDDQGRWISIGIIPETRSSQEQLGAGWAHVYSIPRVWTLDPQRDLLVQAPLPELKQLRGEPVRHEVIDLPEGEVVTRDNLRGSVAEVEIVFDLTASRHFDVMVRRDPEGRETTTFVIDAEEGTFELDRRRGSLNEEVQRDVRDGTFFLDPAADELTLRLFLDNSVIEGFVNDRDAFATRTYPTLQDSEGITFRSRKGSGRIRSVTLWPMRPAAFENATLESLLDTH